MVGEKTLYRSRASVLGGVCAGAAEYLVVDAVVVRTLAVVLAIVTCGLVAVLYLALWVILPKAPAQESVVDVAPESVHSEAHGGQVDASVAAGSSAPFASVPPVGRGAGHVPPRPPAAQMHAQAARTSGAHAPAGASHEGVGPASPAARSETPGADPSSSPAPAPACPVNDGSVRVLLFIGVMLLFGGSAAAFSGAIAEVQWFQFWPLVLVIGGIVGMVVPPSGFGARSSALAAGMSLFAAGAFLLPFTLRLVTWASVPFIVENLWPLFFVMAGFMLIARSADAPAFTLGAAAAVVAFCVFGLAWFAFPGELQQLTVQVFGKTFAIENVWM